MNANVFDVIGMHHFEDAKVYNSLGTFTTWEKVHVGDIIVFIDPTTKRAERFEMVTEISDVDGYDGGHTVAVYFVSGKRCLKFLTTHVCVFAK